MATITIPDELRTQVAARGLQGGLSLGRCDIVAIVQPNAAVPIDAELEREILAGLATPGGEMRKTDWEALRQPYRESHGAAAK
jgi:hypothetical protein